MKRLSLLSAFAASIVAARGQTTFQAEIVGTPGNVHLSWPTTLNNNYQVFMSPDLQTFLDTGITEPGTGSDITYGFMTITPKLFFRVEETPDPYNGGFLVLPTQDQEVDLEDGVCFSFNLDVLPALPDKVRIYQREHGSGDPWEQIGSLTDFDTVKGVRTLRGSAVWIPDMEDEYDVQAAVVDGTGTVIASAVCRVIVGSNQPPTIAITAGPPTPSATSQFIDFTTDDGDDPDGDSIARVEFFDNGVLIGEDREAPFGDDIRDLDDELVGDFWRGTHSITARAIDARGAIGPLSAPFVVQITGGNARPELTITAPANGLIVQEGQTFDIDYTLSDADGLGSIIEVRAEDIGDEGDAVLVSDDTAPFTALTIDTTGWTLGSHTIKVVADDSGSELSSAKFVTVFVRGGAGMTFAEILAANIADELTAAPQGETFTGVEASSDEYTGGGDSGLEIDSGIVMTSGSAALWNAGNDAGDADEGDDNNFPTDNREPGDPVLETRISGLDTNDAAVLEFDVFCTNGQLELEYQFGSEEYIEYVSDGSSGCFNDAFLVTVDGVVVSLLPDCTDIVAPNTIHPEIEDGVSLCGAVADPLNEHLFLDNDDEDDDNDGNPDDDVQPVPGNEDNQVEYDGLTVRMRAHAFVTPGQLHRVRIVIADVSGVDFNDHFLDSGLFIRNGSLRTVTPTP